MPGVSRGDRFRAAFMSAFTAASMAASLGLVAVYAPRAPAAESARELPAPLNDPAPARPGLKTVVLAGGCFWGVQGVFQHVAGVERAVSGYAGGSAADARYPAVSTGRTGHAESVEITYDPQRVSFGQLLRVYFSVAHDPTQLDGQGPDRGRQYRSAVFVADAAQERIAKEYIAQLGAARVFERPIVTRLEPLKAFYPAEAYHQDYLARHPGQPYVAINDLPKIENLKRLFPQLHRPEPKLVGR